MRSDLAGDRPEAPLHAMQRFTAPVQQPPVTAPSPTCQATRQFSGVAQVTESAGRHSGGLSWIRQRYRGRTARVWASTATRGFGDTSLCVIGVRRRGALSLVLRG